MKILITGARGNFPTALIPRLVVAGHSLVLFDLEPMGALDNCVSVQGDLRDAAALTHAMQGCEAVIHAGAYHGGSAETRNYDDHYGVNVTGTHNVLRAMQLHGIKPLVFSSADAVYGQGMRGVRTMDETVACVPTSIFGLTKVLNEEMCRYFARHHGFKIAILRYGTFLPTDWKTAGMGLLNAWVDREDVAQANELALGAVVAEEFACEAFLIHAAHPFAEDDWPDLESKPASVLARYYPGSVEILTAHGLPAPKVHHRYDIAKAIEQLGYDPQHNFEQFLARLSAV